MTISKKNPIYYYLAKVLKDNNIIQDVYNCLLRLIHKKSFLREVHKREEMSLFAYKDLAKPLPFCPLERVKDTNYYGYMAAIKEYAGVVKQDFAIEHGLYFPHDLIQRAARWKVTRRIMTMNSARAEFLQTVLNKPAVAVGPYIHYAKPILGEKEMQIIKQEYGRILLFFPIHSCSESNAIYNVEKIISKVKKIALDNKFDTVFVCMHHRDINYHDYDRFYEEAGFKIVTAGFGLDVNFVRRLKTIVMLSDYVIGNGVGTNIGFCTYLNKPYYIFENSDNYEPCDIDFQYIEIKEAFSNYCETITVKQYEVASKFWGFDCIRSPEEMRCILNGLKH